MQYLWCSAIHSTPSIDHLQLPILGRFSVLVFISFGHDPWIAFHCAFVYVFWSICIVPPSIAFPALTISTANFGAFFYIICCVFSSNELLSSVIGTDAFLSLPPAHILYLYHLAGCHGLLSTGFLCVFFSIFVVSCHPLSFLH